MNVSKEQIRAPRVGIVGSRYYKHRQYVNNVMSALSTRTCVIASDTRGVDKYAILQARIQGRPFEVIKGRFEDYPSLAGMAVSEKLIDRCDYVYVFWDRKSLGTAHLIKLATNVRKLAGVVSE